MIKWLQNEPMHPVVEIGVSDSINSMQVKELLEFLFMDDLPEEMSLSIDDNLYVFRTATERKQWALGFRQAWNLREIET